VIRVALKGLAGRKLRAALTATAIVLGVAMMSGTYVLTDTIDNAFTRIFSASYKNADAIITGNAMQSPTGPLVHAPSFPESVLQDVRRLPDVKAAAGAVLDKETNLIGRDGKVITTNGAPANAFGFDASVDPQLNPLKLFSGRWPTGPDEVGIDSGTASRYGYTIGDTIGVERNGPVRQFRIVGTVGFSGITIGSSTIAVFDQQTLQNILGERGRLDIVQVQSQAGVPPKQLVREINRILPPSAVALSQTDQVKKDKQSVSGFTGVITYILLAFAYIALFVGSFVIANTLSITIAQRTREFATLRTLGATRRQILGSVVTEALVIGILGSVAGLFLGLALARGLQSLFGSLGIVLPDAGTVFESRTVVVCLVVGTVITLVASLRPALRATRVPPIAAVREGAELPPGRFVRFVPFASAATLVLGVVILAYGVLAHNLPTATRLSSVGFGILLLFFGVSLNAARLVRPLASVLGWPGTRLGGAAGSLARDNSMRNPKRTASTASALMIGLALVTLVAILGQGIRTSFESAVDELITANYALTSQSTFKPLPVKAETAVSKAPGVTVVSAIRAGSGRIYGSDENVTGVDPELTKVVHLTWVEGSNAVPASLGQDGTFVDDKFATLHHLHVGSPLTVETATFKKLHLVVKGIFKLPNGGSPFGKATISNALFDANYVDPENEMTFINVRGGVTDANTAALDRTMKAYPDAKVQTQAEFKTNFEKPLNNILDLLYVLLALSVVVSLFGIVNTLVLTVFERTREIGMLRAVGMTRRQTRRMIRHESVVTSLIGAALGIAVGFFLGLLVTHALSSDGIVFAVPYGSIVVFVIAAVIVGILAAIWPARRAAKLNVLAALQYE
jgi:putative ABC transport system permease protein